MDLARQSPFPRVDLTGWLTYGVLSAVATLAVAWIAFELQQEGIAPAVLFPLAVGAALGASLVAAARVAGVPAARVAVVVAVGWGLLAAGAEDYIGHRHRLRAYDAQVAANPLAAAVAGPAEMRPTFGDHLATTLARGGAWWMLDLVLTAAAAAVVVAFGPRWRRRLRSASATPGGEPGETG